MAGANKHTAALSLENEETANFLKPRAVEPPNPLHAMKERLAQARLSPDLRPSELQKPAVVTELDSTFAGTAPTPAGTVQRVSDPVRQVSDEPGASEGARATGIVSDEASIQIPEKDATPNRGGRPLHGKERKVERTVSMHKPLDKLLERLSNMEGLRLDKNVSTASVAVHLMLYALSHVKEDAIFPGEDGLGLAIKIDDDAKGLVATRLRELVALDEAEDGK